MTTLTNVEIMQRIAELSLGGCYDEFDKFIHPECPLNAPTELPYGGLYHGPDGLSTYFKTVFNKVSCIPGAMEFIDVADEGKVIARMDIEFRSLESGRSASSRFVEVWEFKDGKAISIDVFYKSPAAVASVYLGE
jgi:hypothetical protein